MKIKNNFEQRSDAWHEARLGVITGTELKRVLGTPKVREGYFYEILAERLSTESNSTESAMDRGTRLESEALTVYEAQKGIQVTKIGFALSDTSKWVGNSPDGLIEADGKYRGAVDCKCLSSSNHLRAYLTQEIPEEYRPQGIHYFIINDDCEYVDFAFYDPRLSQIPFFTIRLNRSECEKEIAEAKKKVDEFLLEINNAIDKII